MRQHRQPRARRLAVAACALATTAPVAALPASASAAPSKCSKPAKVVAGKYGNYLFRKGTRSGRAPPTTAIRRAPCGSGPGRRASARRHSMARRRCGPSPARPSRVCQRPASGPPMRRWGRRGSRCSADPPGHGRRRLRQRRRVTQGDGPVRRVGDRERRRVHGVAGAERRRAAADRRGYARRCARAARWPGAGSRVRSRRVGTGSSSAAGATSRRPSSARRSSSSPARAMVMSAAAPRRGC